MGHCAAQKAKNAAIELCAADGSDDSDTEGCMEEVS
jgi:hypothetical protein